MRKLIILLLLMYQTLAFGLQDRYFKISETKEFYFSQMEDAEEISALKNEPFLAISLGWNCWPASHLQDHALRKRSFPLDWMITSFETVYKLIETDFYGFLDIHHMTLGRVNKIHGGEFAHDFTIKNWRQEGNGIAPCNEAGTQEYTELLSRYSRRIARFYYIFDLGIPIYLFRWKITKDQAHQLYNLLMQKFPQSDIYLVCIDDGKGGNDDDWGHPKIKHFSIGLNGEVLRPFEDRSRNQEWTKILSSLGLLIYQWNTND